MDDSIIPNNVNTQILNSIRTHVGHNYALESKLSTMLREALFTKGAYCEALIPDTDILKLKDELKAKVSTESMVASMDKVNYLRKGNI